MSLINKPDWQEAKRRWTAFWEREAVDRPCIYVTAPKTGAPPPEQMPESLEDIYLDPAYVTRQVIHKTEWTYYGGEAFPCSDFLMGSYALGCANNVNFAVNTVWHPQSWNSIDEPMNWHPGLDDPWRGKFEKVINSLLDASPGKFLVSHITQVPLNDLMYLLRGPQEFLEELALYPDQVLARLLEALPLWFENHDHFRSMIEPRQEGHAYGWPGLWSEKYIHLMQSDVSCMLSPAMFEQFVMAEMDAQGERYEQVWYHLDGSDAMMHLPALLSRPYLKTIQFVPNCTDGVNGPRWLDFYREVQNAGRCLDILVPWEHVEFLIRHLRPEGLLIRTHAETPEMSEELLVNAVKWSGSHATPSGSGRPQQFTHDADVCGNGPGSRCCCDNGD